MVGGRRTAPVTSTTILGLAGGEVRTGTAFAAGVEVASRHGQDKGPGVDAQRTAGGATRRFFLDAAGFPLPQFVLFHGNLKKSPLQPRRIGEGE